MSISKKAHLRRMASRADHMLGRAVEMREMARSTYEEEIEERAQAALDALLTLSEYLDWRLK